MPDNNEAPPLPTSTRAFFAQIGLHLGVDTDLMLAAACGEPFVAPSGLLCRLHAEQHEATCRAYPEVLLPLAGAELGGADVERLLAIQEHALTEYGWRLGLADEGLLSLRPLFYPDGAEQVATQLDQAQALGRAILSAMLEEAPAAHSVEAQR